MENKDPKDCKDNKDNDTSARIETLRTSGDPAIRARVRDVTADDRAVLCDLVRVELWNGAQASKEHRLLCPTKRLAPPPPSYFAFRKFGKDAGAPSGGS